MSSCQNTTNLKYLIAFSVSRKISFLRFQRILSHFQRDMEAAWQASYPDWLKAGFKPELAQTLAGLKKRIDPDQELAKLKHYRIQVTSWLDQDYPYLLKQIKNPPWILYYQGNLKCLQQPTLAVVGTRQPSGYAQSVTHKITQDLCLHHITIVSGLAQGIDTIAHQVCWQNHQPTVAVLGTDLISQNKRPYLQHILATQGCVLSQFPLFTPASIYTFPIRNCVISGLALGTLVIEAPERSGSLITAYQALEQNREVMAIPANIFNPQNQGTNRLIQLGAKLILNPKDVLETLNLQSNIDKPAKSCNIKTNVFKL